MVRQHTDDNRTLPLHTLLNQLGWHDPQTRFPGWTKCRTWNILHPNNKCALGHEHCGFQIESLFCIYGWFFLCAWIVADWNIIGVGYIVRIVWINSVVCCLLHLHWSCHPRPVADRFKRACAWFPWFPHVFWFHGSIVWLKIVSPKIIDEWVLLKNYPLVNVHITMENHHAING